MNCSTILRGVIVPLIMATLCLAGVARPGNTRTQEKTGTDGQETKAASTQTSASEELVPLEIKLPKPYYVDDGSQGYMVPPSKFFDHASIDYHSHPRQPLLVPKGIQLISLNKSVTSSDGEPRVGELAQVTDGDKETLDGSYIEMHSPGVQWIQLDLGASFDLYAIVIWHNFQASRARIYHDVVVRCADAPDFKANVKTLFNNDDDNSSGLGKGEDLEYAESNWGKQIDCRDKQGKPVRARYIRCYSNGSNFMEMNHYIEVEVYGRLIGAQVRMAENASPETKPKITGAQTSATEELVPLVIKAPRQKLRIHPGPDIVTVDELYANPRPPFMVPKGVKLLSLNKKVTASAAPIIDRLESVTDGDKEEDIYFELEPGVQWVQVDLGESCDVYAIAIWHRFFDRPVYHDVIVQCSDAPDFTANVNTLFNNDSDNSANLGKGGDSEYVDTWQGKLIDAKDKHGKPARARYIRCYSNGSTFSGLNDYLEVEVYGRPCTKAAQYAYKSKQVCSIIEFR